MGSVRVKWLQILPCIILLSACETVRTVYDEAGNVVEEEESSGGEKDLYEHMNKQFNSTFSTKKNESGIPVTTSNKVSSFQRKIDESGRLDKEYSTKEYAEGREEYSTMRFSDRGKVFSTKEAYSGEFGKRLEKDMHPDFAKPSRGLYSTDAAYADGQLSSPLQGMKNRARDERYATKESSYSRDTTSGYVETRRDRTPPPRVYTRDEYYGKSIEDTRSLLGRDKEAEE